MNAQASLEVLDKQLRAQRRKLEGSSSPGSRSPGRRRGVVGVGGRSLSSTPKRLTPRGQGASDGSAARTPQLGPRASSFLHVGGALDNVLKDVRREEKEVVVTRTRGRSSTVGGKANEEIDFSQYEKKNMNSGKNGEYSAAGLWGLDIFEEPQNDSQNRFASQGGEGFAPAQSGNFSEISVQKHPLRWMLMLGNALSHNPNPNANANWRWMLMLGNALSRWREETLNPTESDDEELGDL